MKLIVGLGNPGKKYENTRHNTGFWVVDRLRKELRDPEVVFFKNTSFINNSGMDVKKAIRRFGVSLEGVLVVHDDFDLDLGQFKLQFGRSSAGHKGVQSIIDELGSKDFWRLRIGIGHPQVEIESNDYVLECFSPQEQEVLNELSPKILAAVQSWVLPK